MKRDRRRDLRDPGAADIDIRVERTSVGTNLDCVAGKHRDIVRTIIHIQFAVYNPRTVRNLYVDVARIHGERAFVTIAGAGFKIFNVELQNAGRVDSSHTSRGSHAVPIKVFVRGHGRVANGRRGIDDDIPYARGCQVGGIDERGRAVKLDRRAVADGEIAFVEREVAFEYRRTGIGVDSSRRAGDGQCAAGQRMCACAVEIENRRVGTAGTKSTNCS